MNENMSYCELSERAMFIERLAASIEFACDAMTLRVGYEVEVAGIESIERDGKQNLRIYLRRKPVVLRVVSNQDEVHLDGE
jgi:hypothetical protein